MKLLHHGIEVVVWQVGGTIGRDGEAAAIAHHWVGSVNESGRHRWVDAADLLSEVPLFLDENALKLGDGILGNVQKLSWIEGKVGD